MGQRDDRLLRTAMAEDTLKPGPQRAVLSATRARRRFDQRRTQPAVTVPRFARLMLAGALLVFPGHSAAQLGRGPAVGKALISTPTSAMRTSAVRRLMPGMLSSRWSWSEKGARRSSISVLSVPIASSR